MLSGKVKQALKLVDSNSDITGVHLEQNSQEAAGIDTGNAARVEWAGATGISSILAIIEETHKTISTWKRNFFNLPKNSAAKDVLMEASRILKVFNSRTVWEPIAIHMFVIFFPLMLLKPAAKSKTREHTKYLQKRLALWKEGKLDE